MPLKMTILVEKIKPLLVATAWMGIVPFLSDKSKLFLRNRGYCCTIIAIYLGLFTLGVYFKRHDRKDAINNVVWSVAVFSNLLMMLAAIKPDKIQQLFDNINHFDRIMLNKFKLEVCEFKYFKASFCCAFALFFFMSVWFYVRSEVMYQRTEQFWCLHQYVHWNYFFVKVVLMVVLLCCIRCRLKLLNRVISGRNFHEENTLFIKSRSDEMAHNADAVILLHNTLANVVNDFNGIFEWQLLLTVFYTILRILFVIEMVVKTTNFKHIDAILYYSPWTIIVYVQGVVIATMCEKVVDEGKKTITISYKALYRYSNVNTLREKLFILAQQATARCPQFTAAGFFNVDFSMLFTFVNLITTYVIVIIQFASNNNNNVGTAVPAPSNNATANL